jgi:hypothetical protein
VIVFLSRPAVLVIGAAPLILLAALGVWWVRRRRAARSIPARLQQVSDGMLAGVLIPNADAGQIHLEYALLTRQGIVVVDIRDVSGNVFGSETMHDWTVLTGKQRFTFANPLPVLYDRVAAVKRLLPEVPVRGCVAFTARARFGKGVPPNVVMLDHLFEELLAARATTNPVPADQLQAGWTRLRDEAVSTQVGRLLAGRGLPG